jgi:hypothetical protein
MKSNVKAALGMLVACKSSSDADGLVAVPMLETAPSTSAATLDASVESGVSHRPTVEPRAPQGQTCKRDVSCVDALATTPTWPFSPPYDKCNPTPLGEAGKFSPQETAQRRADEPNTCCYVTFTGCVSRTTGRGGRGRVMIGRPLRDEAGDAIVSGVSVAPERARFWLEGAAAEHASVAEFARLSLVLMAHGAPPELLAETHRAALDEIAHAKTCFTIAAKLTGETYAAGPLDVARADADASIEALARCTLRDGCLGEAAAAMELEALAREEDDADVATAIRGMARDERRHAELAWRILDFAIATDARAAWRAIDAEELFTRTPIEARVVREVVVPRLHALRRRGLNALATRRSPREGGCAREA